MSTVYFLGSARCFHTVDWYESAQKIFGKEVPFVTDLIDGEGFPCLIDDPKVLQRLIVIDDFLPGSYGAIGHKIRNFLKFILAPIQVYRLRRFIGVSPEKLTFAHSTYYAFLGGLAGIRYVSTPQGSEVLLRIERSWLYRVMARIAHTRAILVTVDSMAMKLKLKELLDVDAEIVQNGVPVSKLLLPRKDSQKKELLSLDQKGILSIRGVAKNYQIQQLIQARDSSGSKPNITLCCPFFHEEYKSKVLNSIDYNNDRFLGRLDREQFHETLRRFSIAISIPLSDSSPRSVYEAIFSGCIVIIRDCLYIHSLPICMRSRLVITDCNGSWLDSCYQEALLRFKEPYLPSDEAMCLFDQSLSVQRVIDKLDMKSEFTKIFNKL